MTAPTPVDITVRFRFFNGLERTRRPSAKKMQAMSFWSLNCYDFVLGYMRIETKFEGGGRIFTAQRVTMAALEGTSFDPFQTSKSHSIFEPFCYPVRPKDSRAETQISHDGSALRTTRIEHTQEIGGESLTGLDAEGPGRKQRF
jgi:hypothetical protein